MNSFDFIAVMLGMRSPRMNFGGGGSSGPTAQQVALQTEQGVTNAELNLEENEQRKTMLNALQGTRVFRGSALSRAVASNRTTTGTPFAPPASAAQTTPIAAPVTPAGASLVDNQVGSLTSGGGTAANIARSGISGGQLRGG